MDLAESVTFSYLQSYQPNRAGDVMNTVTIHKRNSRPAVPQVSLILLDWLVRKRFHALDWLSKQNVPREQYELIWIELYNRVVPEVMEKANTIIMCSQKGIYHKQIGYNIGLLHSQGKIITVCDSNAVFPPDFIDSIIDSFNLTQHDEPTPLALMHYEWRTKHTYPDKLSDVSELTKYEWADLKPNVGACMSVRKADAIRFGGFDEDPSFRGYLCGPYDLGWRLVNAGIPERWHDESVALWHFAHPGPPAHFGQPFSLSGWRELAYPHINHHALTAVEAFSTGRILPLKENPEVHKLRMSLRRIGTGYEERYARMTGPTGFSKWERLKFHLSFILEPVFRTMYSQFLKALKKSVGPRIYGVLKGWRHSLKDKKSDVVR